METNKKNLKFYPKYRQFARDFLFFYTINFLFLTQVKHVSMSAAVLIDTFYALFVVLFQMPVSSIIDKIGRKKGIIIGNICNAIYLTIVILSTNLTQLIFAEILSATGFAFKDIAETALLNDSIEETKDKKSKIFAKIQGRAISGYYVLSAISMIAAGFLYDINPYYPMIISLLIVIMTLIMSTKFYEPVVKKVEEKKDKVSIKEAIKFSFKSKRCRSVMLFSGLFYGVICVLATYEIGLVEELHVPTGYIGIMFALLNVVSALSSHSQNKVHTTFKNKTLLVLSMIISIVCILSGFVAKLEISPLAILSILALLYILKYWVVGVYSVLISKYLSNFTNSLIDSKLYAINSFVNSIVSAILGVAASVLVNYISIPDAMMIFGVTILVLFTILLIYIKDKFGLKPEEYSEYEIQYDKK